MTTTNDARIGSRLASAALTLVVGFGASAIVAGTADAQQVRSAPIPLAPIQLAQAQPPPTRAPATGGAAPSRPAAPAAAPQAAAPPEPAEGQNPWVKICNSDPATKREICLTTQEQRADTGQLLASVALREISGEPRKVLLLAVPPAMLLQPGLRVQVDKGKQEEAKYSICFTNACYAEMVIADAFITSMKRGNQLVVTTLNQQGKPVSFPLPLPGFRTSHEGKPIDTQALAKQQQELQTELTRRAEEARQKLIDEQQKAQKPQQ